MTQQDRRDAIVQAALPLLAEHGAAVTTRQIATAAGIAEGTVFRAFGDKDELLRACIQEAMRSDQLRTRIHEVAPDSDTSTRLAEAALLINDHFAHLGQLMRALVTTGYDVHRTHGRADEPDPADVRARFIAELSAALADLLRPEAADLRVPVDELARMLLPALVSVRLDEPEADPLPIIRTRIDVLFHGALRAQPHPGGTHA
nr:TetR/AcrR family transcriptional regulator [Saccharopolyspora sp. HNM0983]